MSQLAKLWAGSIYGTNTGNFFLKFEEVTPVLKGHLRFLDSEYGVALYDVTGSFDETLVLRGTPTGAPDGVTLGELEVSANLTSEGNLRGEWKTSIGTGGAFVGFPHGSEDEAKISDQQTPVPEQFFTHTIQIGAISLYEPDITSLISDLRKDFNIGRAIATYSTGGGEITKYADDFLKEAPTLGMLTYLKLQIQQPEEHGINKVAVVELRRYGVSEIRTQGISESWAIGRAEAIAARLRRYQNGFVTIYKKFGLNLNHVIFIGMLILIPQFSSMAQRAIFVVLVFAMLHGLFWAHSRLVPNANIQVACPAPTQLARMWPSIVSFLFAIVASVVAAFIYTWLVPPG